jgi:hypothetical protein
MANSVLRSCPAITRGRAPASRRGGIPAGRAWPRPGRETTGIDAVDGKSCTTATLDRETVERENKRLVVRLRLAALRQEPVVEELDLRALAASTARCREVHGR